MTVTCGSRETGKSNSFVLRAPVVSSLSITPTTVAGGSNVTGTVTLNAAPATGLTVPLLSSASTATLAASVTVSSGQKTQTFPITTTVPATDTPVTITAGSNVTASLTVTAPPLPVLDGIGLPTKNSGLTITGPRTTTGRVYLDRPAPAAGVAVALSTNGGSLVTLSTPTVTVPAGQTTADFQVINQTVPSETLVNP